MKLVLVVDDVRETTTLLKARLEQTGRFRAVTANSGLQALRLAKEARPDVVLCDINMPGMDGGSFAAAMSRNKKTKEIPIVFISSLVTPEDLENGAGAGGRPMLSKQSPFEEIVSTLDQVLESDE